MRLLITIPLGLLKWTAVLLLVLMSLMIWWIAELLKKLDALEDKALAKFKL